MYFSETSVPQNFHVAQGQNLTSPGAHGAQEAQGAQGALETPVAPRVPKVPEAPEAPENPCLNGSLANCFNLINREMEKTNQLLKLANSTQQMTTSNIDNAKKNTYYLISQEPLKRPRLKRSPEWKPKKLYPKKTYDPNKIKKGHRLSHYEFQSYGRNRIKRSPKNPLNIDRTIVKFLGSDVSVAKEGIPYPEALEAFEDPYEMAKGLIIKKLPGKLAVGLKELISREKLIKDQISRRKREAKEDISSENERQLKNGTFRSNPVVVNTHRPDTANSTSIAGNYVLYNFCV